MLFRSIPHPLHQLYSSPLIDSSRLTVAESDLRSAIPALMSAHSAIKAASELARGNKVLGSSLQCSVILQSEDLKAFSTLEQFKDELDAMFVVSSVELNVAVPKEPEWVYSQGFEVNGTNCTAYVLPPRDHKCPRCWRYVAPKEDELCGRCDEVVSNVE